MASVRTSRLDTNASAIASVVAPIIPSVPSVTGSTPNINGTTGASTNVPQALFKWAPSSGGGTITYTLQYRINGGGWNTINNIANSGSPSYAIPNATFGNTVDVQVNATNTAGTSAWSAISTVTVPLWAVPQLQSSWQNYGGTAYSSGQYDTVGFTRTSAGLVALKGLVKSGSSYPSSIFTLPAGFRPSEQQIYAVIAGSDSAPGRVDVFPDGTVALATGSNGYVSLDSVRFIAAPPIAPAFTPFTPGAGWVYYSTPYATPGYYVDSVGRVNVKGLVKNGSTGALWTFPSISGQSLAPSEISYSPSLGGDNNFAEYSLQPAANSNALGYVAGVNSYITLQSIFYPAGATTWTNLTMQNSWINYGSPYTVPAFTKASDGVVTIKGFIKSGTAANNTVLATLPAGYRPKQEMIFEVAGTDREARVDIGPNGNIILVYAYSNAWLSLDNISFLAEQ